MMEANTGNLNPLDLKKSVYCPGAKRLMALIKLMKLFVLRSESDPLGTTGGVFYLIPLLKNTYSRYSHLQITIGIVTVNLLFLQLVSN
jgi:hypothetical protein